uniref:Chromosome 10 open reading frame 105 n=1 Tax=Oryctolagus cuniculus TaxID=9986 RepID=A0A5F9D5Y8_RABIT
MSTEAPSLTGSPVTSPLAFLTAQEAAAGTLAEAASPVPVLVALACIFLLLATCLLFMALCKPACMPHHPGSPSEPQLRLWKAPGWGLLHWPATCRCNPTPGRPLSTPSPGPSPPSHDYTLWSGSRFGEWTERA